RRSLRVPKAYRSLRRSSQIAAVHSRSSLVLGSGVVALWAGLGKTANGPRRFGLIFGAIYMLLALAGFAGMRNLGPIQLDLNTYFNFIHLGVGLLSLAAGFASAKAPQ